MELLPLSTSLQLTSLKQAMNASKLMSSSVSNLKNLVDAGIAKPIDIPGHGEAGSYEHNCHQDNSRLIESVGLLYKLTGNSAYAAWVIDALSRYAKCYLQLGFQKQKNTNPPGRLFHQILNENMWLLYVSIGYGYVRDQVDPVQRKEIEQGLFRPMVELFTVTYGHDFDRIHNHGLWAVAAVGICGLVIEEPAYVDLAVRGQKDDCESGGFLAQISKLFAPSGYYIEGPYYHRFALRPLCLFAEALQTHRPELDIYNFKNQLIRTTIRALLSTAYPNGCFPALNDSSKTMGLHDEGVLIAMALHHTRYGSDSALLAMAEQQGRVWVHPAGLALSQSVDTHSFEKRSLWPSVELNEGPNGDRGAQGFLRTCAADGDGTQVVMNYGQHGMGHGHFDTLGITLFNRDEEVLRDYGFARWINVETKFGGRYLPENKSYARQTVAHNCVVVDGQTQNGFDVDRADSVHGVCHYFIGEGPMKVMSGFANDHYPGVEMQRTVLLLDLPELSTPAVVDLYRLKSATEHNYDYSLQYQGQICQSNAAIVANETWKPLGQDQGYQHLLGLAEAELAAPLQLTWLQGKRFNTWLCAADQGHLTLTQTGASDPSFNLRRETSFLLRQKASTHLFASVFETHGYFDESTEKCFGAHGQISSIRVLGHSDEGSVIQITTEQSTLVLMFSNRPDVSADTQHTVTFDQTTYAWQGFFASSLSSK